MAQNKPIDDEAIRRIVQAIQSTVAGKVHLLPVDASFGFAKGANWGLTTMRDWAHPFSVGDTAVLGTVELKQKMYFNNVAIDPGRYFLVKFSAVPVLNETQAEKQPQQIQLIFVSVPAAGSKVDITQIVKSSLARVSPAWVARRLTQSVGYNLFRYEGLFSNTPVTGEFTFGATFGGLSVCWPVSAKVQPAQRNTKSSRLPALVIHPATPEGYAAMDDEVTFDATSSRDPDGQIKAVAWEFEGNPNSISEHILSSPATLRTTHIYTHTGKFSVMLKALDNQCGYAQTTQAIEIRPWLNVTIKLSPDYLQVPSTGPIALRADVINNSLSRRFEGQTFVAVDETPLFGPAPIQVDPRQGLAGVPASFDFSQPQGIGKHRLSVILKQANGTERGRDDASFEVPLVSVALKAVGDTQLTNVGQIRFDTQLANIIRSDFKGTIELILTKPDKSKKSLGPKQPIEVKAGNQQNLPVAFPALGLPKGNLIFTVELRSTNGTKIDQASIVYVIK